MDRYQRLNCNVADRPVFNDPATDRVLDLLLGWADSFAGACRRQPHPKAPLDLTRSPQLLCAVGLGRDECAGFLRALEAGIVTVSEDGNFRVPAARQCSQNLHVVGRQGNQVGLHNEVLIHVTMYAELVLDYGWPQDRIVFDPFFANDALDLWGYDAPPTEPDRWREGTIIFAAEAKSRVDGGDGLRSLAAAFERLSSDPSAKCAKGQKRKWDELVLLTRERTIEVLLAADGARWWYKASPRDSGITLQARPKKFDP